MDPSAFWQLNLYDRAEALALLPSVLALFLPFLICNVLLLRKNVPIALLISLYSYGSTIFWLTGTNCFQSMTDPLALLIPLFCPTLLVRLRLHFEFQNEPIRRGGSWIAWAQLAPTILVCVNAANFLPL